MDEETHGSQEKQQMILLTEIRENGRLFILEELNRDYRVLSTEEFDRAAKQSGLPPSELSDNKPAG